MDQMWVLSANRFAGLNHWPEFLQQLSNDPIVGLGVAPFARASPLIGSSLHAF